MIRWIGTFSFSLPLTAALLPGLLLAAIGGCRALNLASPAEWSESASQEREGVGREDGVRDADGRDEGRAERGRGDSEDGSEGPTFEPDRQTSQSRSQSDSLPESLVVYEPSPAGFTPPESQRMELSGWYQEFNAASSLSGVPHPMAEPESPERIYRWRHDLLDQLLAADATTPLKKARLREATRDKSPFVQATGWIGLARLEPTRHDRQLERLVTDAELPLETRRAAAETAGRTVTLDSLLDLSDRLTKATDEGLEFTDHPMLFAELLVGFALHGSEAGADRLRGALASDLEEIRVAALAAWSVEQSKLRTALPSEAMELLHRGSPAVRAAAITAAGLSGDPTLEPYVLEALRDADLTVRLSAIAALGQLDSERASETLDETFRGGGPAERAAVIQAWSEVPEELPGRLAEAARDPAWQVRSVVAHRLRNRPSVENERILRELLEDSSSAVQLHAALAAATWPRDQAVPLLLEAAGSTAHQTREAALERLVELWPETRPLLAIRSARERSRALEQLESRWNQVQTTLAAADPDQLQKRAEGYLSQAQSRVFDRLQQGSAEVRRQAAQELAEWAETRPQVLSQESLETLQETLRDEPDAAVWQQTLRAVAARETAASRELVRTSLDHRSEIVRLAGLEQLLEHPDAAALAQLDQLLKDPAVEIQAAAARAYAASLQAAVDQGVAELDFEGRVNRVKQLLAETEPPVQIAAAMALCELRSASGPAALDRLSLHRDPAVRRQVASAIGIVRDPQLRPILERLREDEPSVRRIAEIQLQDFPEPSETPKLRR